MLLADVGARPEDYGTVPSMLLGALLVGWVSYGVLAARTGRLAVAWVLLVLGLLSYSGALVDAGVAGLTDLEGALFATAVAEMGSLIWFSSTAYYAWQRTRPRVKGPSTHR